MGDLGHVLTADQAAEIGAVDVIMVPVGGYYTIDAAQAWRVIDQLNARIAMPMHYSNDKCLFPIAGVEDFIAGRPNVVREGVSSIEVTPANLPAQQTVIRPGAVAVKSGKITEARNPGEHGKSLL